MEHRRKFYHLGYVDYSKDYPAQINFIPSGELLKAFKNDYDANMVDGYIYGEAKTFEALMNRMQELLSRFREMRINE